MSLESIITRLQTIEASITGITRAYDEAPESIGSVDLPAVLNIPGEGSLATEASGWGRTDHTIHIQVLVTPRTDLPSDEAKVRPFVNRFRDAFAHAEKLNDLSTVAHAELTAYRYGVFAYAGQEYLGVEFTLEVTEKEAITVDT